MLFPAVDKQLARIVVGIIVGVLVTVAAIILIAFIQARQLDVVAAATATATKTPTKAATSTATATATSTSTNTPTSTATPTNTPTTTPTSTPTETSTPTPVPPTATPVPPTATLAPVITDTLIVDQPQVITEPVEAISDTTLTITQTTTITGSGVITVPVGTPTPTPTPVPRTVLVPTDIPPYQLAEDHFWFARPFTYTLNTWGSYYYPYGTNARGQYFWHQGIDIQNSQGTPILAIGDGTVIHAGPDIARTLGPWPDFYGQAVVIEHDQQWNGLPIYSLYGHVSRVLVQEGQQVKTGDTIALVGQLGVALGPHLHLEIRSGAATYNDTLNPDLWVRPDPGFGVIAGRVVDHEGYYVPEQLVTLHREENPSKFWRQTYTYPDNVVNSDFDYGETFTFSDVPAGRYLVKTFFDGRQLTIPITVTNGQTSFVLLKQDLPPPPPKTAAPTATATPQVTTEQVANPEDAQPNTEGQ